MGSMLEEIISRLIQDLNRDHFQRSKQFKLFGK
jgi:hypothetical protein